jgi:acyl carrier protein
MTRDDARTLFASALAQIAPDLDLDDLDADAPFQEEADIDSMDFLNLVTWIYEHAGIEIPESDYAKLSTLTEILGYLEAREAHVR